MKNKKQVFITMLAVLTFISLATGVALAVTTIGATNIMIDTGVITEDRIILSVTGGGTARFDGTITNPDLTAARTWIFPDLGGTVTVLGNATTGTGDIVRATSPTLVTPILGVATATSIVASGAVRGGTIVSDTAASGLVLGSGTNATTFSSGATTVARAIGFPDVSGTVMVGATSTAATHALFATGIPGAPAFRAIALTDLPVLTGSGSIVLATSPVLITPNLGTPSAANLANAIGLPIATGVAGLGTGVATALATPTSANLIAAVTDETGTGALVFATSPTLVTPALGAATATSVAIGGGTAITGHFSATVINVVSASIGAAACANYATVTLSGAAVGDTAIANPTTIAGGIETVNLSWSAFATAGNVVIRACNPTATAIDTPDTQTWRVGVWKY